MNFGKNILVSLPSVDSETYNLQVFFQELYRLKELLGNFGASEHFSGRKKGLSNQKRLTGREL